MMELKVHCDCGQKYKFDVEPANGQMPFTVACPICKRDGTAKANAMLQTMSVFKPADGSASASASVAPPPLAAGSSAPAPIAPPAVPSAPGRLRINMAAHAEAAPGAPPPIAPALGAGAAGAPRPRLGAAAVAAGEPGQKGNFWMGLLGAVIGALVGSLVYFFIVRTTGTIPFLRYFLAVGVGGLTGWLANLLGKGEGSKELGGLAAVFTIIGIVGAQYLLTMEKWHAVEDKYSDVREAIEDGGYSANVKEAKEVVKAIPTGTDAEIRMYIAKQQTEEGQAPKLEMVSSDEVKQFRESELTNYQDLASGKLTKEQYWAKNNFDPKAAQRIRDNAETTIGGLAVIFAVLKAGIISMVVGAATAYRLSTNA